jgi:GTP-binding protein HflX
MLFATLDSTLRKVQVPNYGTAILADTVGFVRDLPHQLVDAFRATLEETVEARLLLHVVDCNNDERQLQIEEVNKVLAEIGADAIPTLMVFNKVDLLDDKVASVERDEQGKPVRAWVSAHTGAGIGELLVAIGELLGGEFMSTTLTLKATQGRQRAHLYKLGVVQAETTADNGDALIQLHMPRADLLRLIAEEQMDLAAFAPSPQPELPPSVVNPGMSQVDEAL